MQKYVVKITKFYEKAKRQTGKPIWRFLFYKEIDPPGVAPLDKKSLTNRTYMSAYSIVI
jgi:hypothetical protein